MALSSLAIKLSNLCLFASTGSVLPYLSVYFVHYTQANSIDVGVVMLISSLLGIILNLAACSLADRHQVHRTVYAVTLLLAYILLTSLLLPIYLDYITFEDEDEDDLSLEPLKDTTNHTEHQPHHHHQHHRHHYDVNDETFVRFLIDAQGHHEPGRPAPSLPAPQESQQQQPVEHRTNKETIDQLTPTWFYLVAILIALGTATLMVCQSMSDAFSVNIAHRCGQSYGSMRFWAAIGWMAASLAISFLNTIDWMPFLLPSFLCFAALAAVNILVVVLWRDSRPFDMSSTNSSQQAHSIGKLKSVVRSSLFGCCRRSRSHPAEKIANGEFEMKFAYPLTGIHSNSNQIIGTMNELTISTLRDQPNDIYGDKSNLMHDDDGEDSGMSLRLYVKVIELIARRSKFMLRFNFLYIIIGIVYSMNSIYLFPYLNKLDPDKFKSISAYVMFSCYLSESIFYQVSGFFIKVVPFPVGLSLVLVILAARYSLYLLFLIYPTDVVPLESIIVIELLQALTTGWLNCIMNEAASMFADEAADQVDELVRLGLVHSRAAQSAEALGKMRDGVASTMIGVSSCAFDGIGIALGSVAGGLIIHQYNFMTFWLTGIMLALLAGALNLLPELKSTCYAGC